MFFSCYAEKLPKVTETVDHYKESDPDEQLQLLERPHRNGR